MKHAEERKRERTEEGKGNELNGENGERYVQKKQKLSSSTDDSMNSDELLLPKESILSEVTVNSDELLDDKEQISPGDKGFFIQYDANPGKNHDELVIEIFCLLNEYANKLYRTDARSCYFKEKLVGDANRSPIFIESDIEDPCLLADAILKDLLAANTEAHLETLKWLYTFLPVNRICTIQNEDVIDNVKIAMEPFFAGQKTGDGVGSNCAIRPRGKELRGQLGQQIWRDVKGYIDSKVTPEKREAEACPSTFVCIRSFEQKLFGKTEDSASICCITVTKNDDLLKNYFIKKILTSKGEKPKAKKGQKGQMTPILPNQRGFLLSYNTNRPRDKYVSDAMLVLNEYADKLYRSKGKDCYFEEKRLMNPKSSPIFIESDIDDPTLLADAIFTDLRAGHESIALQKAKSFSRFVPVTTTCKIEYEEIIRNVKAVLEPMITEPTTGSGSETRSFDISLSGNIFQKGRITTNKVREGIIEYLTTKGVEGHAEPNKDSQNATEKGKEQQEIDSRSLISIRSCSNGKLKHEERFPKDICCITVAKNGNQFRNYCV